MSHHGTTRKIVKQMAHYLGEENTTVIDLKKGDVPDLDSYDSILIGGSIHVGQIQKKIRMFCVAYEDVLLLKRIGLFMCSLDTADQNQEYNSAFPERLRKHALAHGFFGGELLLDKMSLFEKYFVQTIYGINKNVYELDDEAIELFGQKMAH